MDYLDDKEFLKKFEGIDTKKFLDMENITISHEYSKLEEYISEYLFCEEELKEFMDGIKHKKYWNNFKNPEETYEGLQMSLEDSISSYERKLDDVANTISIIRTISAICLIFENRNLKIMNYEKLQKKVRKGYLEYSIRMKKEREELLQKRAEEKRKRKEDKDKRKETKRQKTDTENNLIG